MKKLIITVISVMLFAACGSGSDNEYDIEPMDDNSPAKCLLVKKNKNHDTPFKDTKVVDRNIYCMKDK